MIEVVTWVLETPPTTSCRGRQRGVHRRPHGSPRPGPACVLLEAGGRQTRLRAQARDDRGHPPASPQLKKKFDWGYNTTPQKHANDRGIPYDARQGARRLAARSTACSTSAATERTTTTGPPKAATAGATTTCFRLQASGDWEATRTTLRGDAADRWRSRARRTSSGVAGLHGGAQRHSRASRCSTTTTAVPGGLRSSGRARGGPRYSTSEAYIHACARRTSTSRSASRCSAS